MPARLWFVVFCLSVAALPAAAQYYPSYGYGTVRSNERVKADGGSRGALPTFAGLLRGSTGKGLSLEADDGNLLTFTATKKTVYLDGKRKLKAHDLKSGEYVSVEARMNLDGTLEAVAVSRQDKLPAPGSKLPADEQVIK